MTDMIHATINGVAVEVEAGATILEAARKVHVKIPTLCKHPDLEATAACGICIVKVNNTGKMLRSCCTPIETGMVRIDHSFTHFDLTLTLVRREVPLSAAEGEWWPITDLDAAGLPTLYRKLTDKMRERDG